MSLLLNVPILMVIIEQYFCVCVFVCIVDDQHCTHT